MAGADPAKMARLPNAGGMKNEIIMHRSQRFPYDQCYTATGATIVDIGDGRRCHPWELEAAINENTAAVAYLFSGFLSRRAIPFEQVVEIAHAHDLPVIVDAASYLPPRANLTRFIEAGADMVQFSGGKAVRGPQGTGILAGRADLIEAGLRQRQPAPVHRARHEGRQGGDNRPCRSATHLRVRRRGRRKPGATPPCASRSWTRS